MRDVSDTLELAELTEPGLLERERRLAPAGVGGGSGAAPEPQEQPVEFTAPPPREPEAYGGTVTNFVGDGPVAVAVRHDGPLRTTLRATRQRFDVIGV
jgi:hypothetical protein